MWSATRRPQSRLGMQAAQTTSSELYHDQEQDEQAAATLSASRRPTPHAPPVQLLDNEESLPWARSGVAALFRGLPLRDVGDRAKQRAALDAALATQAYDIEVLIECYQFPDASADYRGKVRKLIQKKLCELREQIGDNAVAQPCNEFAWLVANTEGNLDEALRDSKRSLETVARTAPSATRSPGVYYAKGDLDEALKQQAAAAALLPHTRAVTKQLECSARRRPSGSESRSPNRKNRRWIRHEPAWLLPRAVCPCGFARWVQRLSGRGRVQPPALGCRIGLWPDALLSNSSISTTTSTCIRIRT